MRKSDRDRRSLVIHVAAVEYTATKLLLPQLRELARRGYDVRLACAPDGPTFDPRLEAFQPTPLSFPRTVRPGRLAQATLDLARLMRRVRPEIVHLHTPAAALPARLLPRFAVPTETRVVYTVHGFAHVWDRPGRRDRVLEAIERVLARRTDMLLFQSQEDLARTREVGYRTRLRYLGNGVETRWFAVAPKEKPSRPLELLYVGRLIREKGLLDLFDALGRVHDVRLTLAGSQLPTDRDGVEDELRARAGRGDLAGRVRFVGMVEKDELERLVGAVDMLVLPSYREGVPRSLIEGFATGTPAIATDVRGCRELVEDSVTGFLAPPHDPPALAHALRRAVALNDDGYRALSRRAATLASEHYRESAVFDRLCAAYEELGVGPWGSLGPSVVGDDLRGPDSRPASAPPQEEDGARGVGGEPIVDDSVEQPEPGQQHPDHPAEQARTGEGTGQVVDAPQQLGSGSGNDTGVDLVEVAEQVSVPAQGEPGEVVGPGVHVLQERRLGVDQPVRAQDPVDLGHDDLGGDDVLEDGLRDDGVDRPVRERDGVGVGDDLDHITAEEVETDDLDIRPQRVEQLGSVADGAAADHQDAGVASGKKLDEPSQLLLGDLVPGLDDAPQG
jgi:glycosyltransferase involved in cell wall biosynthesis